MLVQARFAQATLKRFSQSRSAAAVFPGAVACTASSPMVDAYGSSRRRVSAWRWSAVADAATLSTALIDRQPMFFACGAITG
jgi:hypothetical protein